MPNGDAEVTVAIGELLLMRELGLRVVAGAAGLARGVSWAQVSELVDPTEFLRGGELLLLTGVNLPAGDAAQRGYVERLAEAGVAAVGFGIGLTWDEVPPALVSAAESAGLALLAVPRAVPFLAISRAVAAGISRQEQAAKNRLAAAQRALTAASVGPGGQGALLDELIRLTGGWGLLLNRAGGVLAAAPDPVNSPDTAARRTGLTADLARLRNSRGPASLVASSAAAGSSGSQVWVQSLHAGSELIGFLAIGRDGGFSAADRQVVNMAVPLGILLLDRAGALGRSVRRLRTSVLRLLLAGQADLVAEVAGELWNGLPAEPLVVLVGQGGRNALITARERLAADRAVGSAQIVYGELDDELVCVCSAGAESGAGAGAASVGGTSVGGTSVGAASVGGTSVGGTSAGGASAGGASAGGTSAGAASVSRTSPGAASPGGASVGGTSAGAASAGGSGLGGADVAAVLRAVRGIDGLRFGGSEPTALGALGSAADQARQAAPYGTGVGNRVSWFAELPRVGLLELVPEPSATEFSVAVLRPLRGESAGARGDLLHSLKVWLAHHGQWDPAAAELGVHRHTLRNRVRKAERLLGRELDSPDLRAELWLALRLAERTDPGPSPPA